MLLPNVKSCLKKINERSNLRISVTGRKPELVQRLTRAFIELKESNQAELYLVALRCLEESFGSEITTNPYPVVNGGYAASNVGHSHPPPHTVARPAAHGSNGLSTVGRRPGMSLQTASPQARPNVQFGNFITSPFFKIQAHIGEPRLCPPAYSSKPGTAKIAFSLTGEQIVSLRPGKDIQLRLFCTTLAANQASMSGKHPAPIEFPKLSDARVNTQKLSVNIRGKKSHAKILPPNVNKDGRLNLHSGLNEVDLLYSDTSVAYVLSLAICIMTSPETLAERVIKDKVKSKEQVLSEMKRAAQDDDIEVGEVSITLKCPLSYMRLNNPCRSSLCAHIQCFDAHSFFSVNEQTPTWECPVCFKKVDPDGLFLDGYVRDILQRVPDSEEQVIIDAEGKWRTPNNKYRSHEQTGNTSREGASTDALSVRDGDSSYENKPGLIVKGEAPPDEDLVNNAQTPPLTPSMQSRASGSRARIEVYDLDDMPSPPPRDSNDDAGPSQTNAVPLSNDDRVPGSSDRSPVPPLNFRTSAPPSTAVSASPAALRHPSTGQASGVIDLTLSDDEDNNQSGPSRAPLPPNSMLHSRPTPYLSAPQNGYPTRPMGAPPSHHGLSPAPSSYNHHVTPPAPAPAPTHNPNRFPLDRFLIPLEGSRNKHSASGSGPADAGARSTSTPNIVPLMRNVVTDGAPAFAAPSRSPMSTSTPFTAAETNGHRRISPLPASSSAPTDGRRPERRSPPLSERNEVAGSEDGTRPYKRPRITEAAQPAQTAGSSSAPPEGDEFDEFGELSFFDDEGFWTDPNSGLSGPPVTTINGHARSSAGAMSNNSAATPHLISSDTAQPTDELLADDRSGLSGPVA
jgi:E3 SUMO-protein ligase PIAS1